MDQPAQTADVTEEFLTELRTINKHLARICRATEDALGAQQSARSTPRSPLEQFQAEADSQALRWRVAQKMSQEEYYELEATMIDRLMHPKRSSTVKTLTESTHNHSEVNT